MTARDKAASGLWMLKQAIFELLSQPENRGGMRPFEVREALGLCSAANAAPGIATHMLKWMADDGELEKTDEHTPSYFLPRNCDTVK